MTQTDRRPRAWFSRHRSRSLTTTVIPSKWYSGQGRCFSRYSLSQFTSSIALPFFCLHSLGFDWLLMTIMPACTLRLVLVLRQTRPLRSIPHISHESLPHPPLVCNPIVRLADGSFTLSFTYSSLLTSMQNLFVRIRRAFTRSSYTFCSSHFANFVSLLACLISCCRAYIW